MKIIDETSYKIEGYTQKEALVRYNHPYEVELTDDELEAEQIFTKFITDEKFNTVVLVKTTFTTLVFGKRD